jgi:hypothetical protein
MRNEHEAMHARTPQAVRDAATPNPELISDDDEDDEDNGTPAAVDGGNDY